MIFLVTFSIFFTYSKHCQSLNIILVKVFKLFDIEKLKEVSFYHHKQILRSSLCFTVTLSKESTMPRVEHKQTFFTKWHDSSNFSGFNGSTSRKLFIIICFAVFQEVFRVRATSRSSVSLPSGWATSPPPWSVRGPQAITRCKPESRPPISVNQQCYHQYNTID